MICSLTKEGIFNPGSSRIKIFQDRAKGLDVASFCQRCDSAPCIDACPMDALRRNRDTNTIVVESETCIGEKCLNCTLECPYGAINWDIACNSIISCDLCGGDPECVKNCQPRALLFEECDATEVQEQENELQRLLRPFVEFHRAEGKEV